MFMRGEEIGSGYSGTVYSGIDINTNSRVALKYFKDSHTLMCEYTCIRYLNSCSFEHAPFIIEKIKKERILVLSLVDFDHIARNEDLFICEQALRKLHTLDVIHNDPNRDNFLITKDGFVFIIDYAFSFMSIANVDKETEIDQLYSNFKNYLSLNFTRL